MDNGISQKFTTALEDFDFDFDFADDLALLSSKKKHIQEKVVGLNKYSKEIGMKSDTKKTKLMRYNTKDQTLISIDGKDAENVDSFVYLR